MDNFLREYSRKCKSIVSENGFKQHKRMFGRVVNDVYQNFYIEKLGLNSNGRACRVGFAVLPLCQKLEVKQISDGIGIYYLRKFEVVQWTEGDGWRYRSEPESINSCTDEIIRYLTSYLIPFFERADSCNTALQELIDLEKLFNDNRKATLKLAGIEDKAGPNTEVNMLDSAKYFMALKNGDYKFAMKSRRALEQQNIRSYSSMSEKGCLTEEDRARRENSLAELRKEITHLETGDKGYVQRMIEENEAHSREVLKALSLL